MRVYEAIVRGLESVARRPAVTDAHHLETGYYERYFRDGMTDAHRRHDALWH